MSSGCCNPSYPDRHYRVMHIEILVHSRRFFLMVLNRGFMYPLKVSFVLNMWLYDLIDEKCSSRDG